MTVQDRQPAGTPVGGQFAAGARPAPLSALTLGVGQPDPDAELSTFDHQDVFGPLLAYPGADETEPWFTEQSLTLISAKLAQIAEQDDTGATLERHGDAWILDQGPSADDSERVVELAPAFGARMERLYQVPGFGWAESEPWDDAAVEAFVADAMDSYRATAVWSSAAEGEDGETVPMDAFDAEWSQEAVTAMRDELADFVAANSHLIEAAATARADYEEPGAVAHDFWLTRNGHGAGFWDRGIGQVGDRLTEAAKAHGSCDLEIGDDGLIHVL